MNVSLRKTHLKDDFGFINPKDFIEPRTIPIDTEIISNNIHFDDIDDLSKISIDFICKRYH